MIALFESLLARLERAPPSVLQRATGALLPFILPISSGLGLTIVKLDDEGACVELPLKRKTKNHVGTIYLGALLIVAEVAMAITVLRRFRPSAFRVLVKSVSSENTAEARGRVVARCIPDEETRRVFASLDALAPGEKGEVHVVVPVHSVDDDRQVARVTFQVSVKKPSPKPA